MKGHSVKIDSFHKHSEKEFKSVRPDSYQYKENFKEENNEKMDYKEYSHRTPAGPEYKKFKDSFDEMHNINNIKFSTEHVELPNPSSINYLIYLNIIKIERFDIEPRQLLKKKFTDSVSLKFILYLSMGGLWLVLGL